MTVTTKENITFIGFGEAATGFVKGWREAYCPDVKAFDIKTRDPSEKIRQKKRDEYDHSGVEGCESLSEALETTDVIFSMVTADQALIAAKSAKDHIAENILYLDCNSCAPDTKRRAAAIISAAGGRYVDVAVMAPVQSDLSKVPLLLSGPHTDTALKLLEKLNMSARIIEGNIGTSSSIKMMRSIMVKGMEALMLECVLSASKAGVDDIVLDSLEVSFPGFKWKDRAAYMLERVMTHGKRRAAEMREVALSIEQLGLEGKMARATAEWQQLIGGLELDNSHSANQDYQKLAKRITIRLDKEKEIHQNIKNWSVELLIG